MRNNCTKFTTTQDLLALFLLPVGGRGGNGIRMKKMPVRIISVAVIVCGLVAADFTRDSRTTSSLPQLTHVSVSGVYPQFPTLPDFLFRSNDEFQSAVFIIWG